MGTSHTPSAIEFHVQSFGADVLSSDSPVLEAFVAEAVLGDNLDRALTGADPHPHLS